MKKTGWFLTKLDKALLTPIRSMKARYVPLLLIYFAYGASGFSAIALSFWEKDNLTLSAEQLVTISVWVMVPWTLKMVFGQMVDSVSIFGSRRKIYVYLGALLMVIGTFLLAGLAGKHEWVMWIGSEYTIYLLSAVFSTLGFVIQDVTADTMTTEVVDRYEAPPKNSLAPGRGGLIPRTEKAIQGDLAMVQVLGRLALSIAGFLVAGLGGYLAGAFAYETVFWMTLVLPLISCIGVSFFRLEEVQDHERQPLNMKILGGGLAFAVFSVVMAVTDIPYSQEIVFVVSLALLSAMFCLVTKNLPRSKFKVLAFTLIALFLYRATPGVGPGLGWWFIDELGFDPAFFGVLAQLGAGVALFVLWFFSDFIANWPIRSVLLFLAIIETVMSMPELLLYFNVHEMIGVGARTVALFDTALGSPLIHVSMVPMLALIAFYAPAGYRGTWFAIGASLMNLALSAGKLLTKYLNEIFVVTREVVNDAGEILVTADYSDLGVLMITKITISLVLPLGAVLIFLRKTPRVQEEQVVEDLSEEAPIPSRKRISNDQ